MRVTPCQLDREEREALLNAFLSVCTWQTVYYLWRPNLPDEADNHLVELAVAGGCRSDCDVEYAGLSAGGTTFPWAAYCTTQ